MMEGRFVYMDVLYVGSFVGEDICRQDICSWTFRGGMFCGRTFCKSTFFSDPRVILQLSFEFMVLFLLLGLGKIIGQRIEIDGKI